MRNNTDIRDRAWMRRRARLASVVVVLGLAGLTAACGDDGESSQGVATVAPDAAADAGDDRDGGDEHGDGDGDGDDVDYEDAMAEYTSCMRDEGVDMSQPIFVGEDGDSVVVGAVDAGEGSGEVEMDAEDIDELINDDDYQAAQEKCEPLMEGAFQDFELDPEEQAEMQDQMLEWAKCMRDRGHDVDDPTFTDDGGAVVGATGAGADDGPDVEDEEFRDDSEACDDEVGMGEDGPVHGRNEPSSGDGAEGGAGK